MKHNILKEKSFWLSVVVCLLPVLPALIWYDRLPEQMATHFDANFNPNGFSPKWQAVWMIPGILTIANIFVWFMLENDPKKSAVAPALKTVSRWIVPVISFFAQTAILLYALNEEINLTQFLPLLIGVMMVVLGKYLPMCKQNYTVGIRLPWTLASEENWNRTHRIGGKVMMICGLILALCTWVPVHPVLILVVIIAAAFVPAVYSYLLFKKGI